MSDRFDEIKRMMRSWDSHLPLADQRWLVAEVERLRAKYEATPERHYEDPRPYVAGPSDTRAVWRSEDAPAYGEHIDLHFNYPPKELHYMTAVVTRVDRPGPPPIIDDDEPGHTVVYDVIEDCE